MIRYSTDGQLYVKTSATCSKNRKPWVRLGAEFGSCHVGVRMEWVHLDVVGPLPESDLGSRFIMVTVDWYSKWVKIQSLEDIFAETTACTTVDQFFTRFGCYKSTWRGEF